MYIRLRKGLRWSDGEPFSADDMMFYFEDWQYNTDIAPSLASQWRAGGEPMTVTKMDDYTVQFGFAAPNPSFALLHRSGAPVEPWRPKHWMQQFHAMYNPSADADAKAQGFNNWQARFTKLGSMHFGAMDPSLPVLAPWHTVRADSQAQIYERNPYYFKVDTEGKQLPYADTVDVHYVSDQEAYNLRTLAGELSVSGLDLLIQNWPVLEEGQADGNYTLHMALNEHGADVAIAFNPLHPDPVLREIFSDVRFRQAVSVAIDRAEINDLVFLGQGTPRQATINETASFFKQEWADHYAQYDPDLAAQILDDMGLSERDSEGIRLRPDGRPLEFQIEYLPHQGPKKDVCELAAKHLGLVGLKVSTQERERNFLLTRLAAGEQDCTAWQCDRTLERSAYAYGAVGSKLGPGGNSAIAYAQGWLDWFASGGKKGTEPPEAAKDLRLAFHEWQGSVFGTPEYVERGIRVHDLVAENLWVIGIVGQAPQPVAVKRNLKNVLKPDQGRYWWGAASWYFLSTRAEQWFFVDDQG